MTTSGRGPARTLITEKILKVNTILQGKSETTRYVSRRMVTVNMSF